MKPTRLLTPAIFLAFSLFSIEKAASQCAGLASVTLNIVPAPTAQITGNLAICSGQSTTLTASGGSAFLWSTGATTPSITVSPTTQTPFSVTVTNGGASGCTDTEQVVVDVQTPIISIIANPASGSICAGQSIILDADGASSLATYAWSTGATTQTITAMPAATTTFSVTVTDDLCTTIESITVTVNGAGTASAGPDQAICEGQNASLTASGGTSYAWSNGQNTATISVSPAATTTYTVTVTSGAGCTSTDEAEVTVNAPPTASAGPGSSICVGQSATITASGGTTFLWSNGQNTATITVSPVATTNYVVTVSSGAGTCSATATAQIEVTSLALSIVPVNPAICPGGSILIEAVGPSSAAVFAWSTGDASPAITVSPAATTVYTVTVTDGPCTATSSISVAVNPLPTANAGADQAICAGASATLTATGGTSFSWSNGANSASTTVSPAATATFSVTVSNAAGCTATDDVDVILAVPPTVSAGPDQSICVGGSTVLTAVGAGTFLWSNGATTASTTVSPAVATTFSVTLTDANGCTVTDAVLVDVGVLTASITPSQTVCAGESATLAASGGTVFLWSNGATTPAITVSPVLTTPFSVTVSDPSGCSDDAASTVTVASIPTANAGADQAICAGAAATLTATGGTSFSWSNGANSASTTVSPAATTTFSVTVSNAAGCTDVDAVQVAVNPLPTVSAGADQAICAGQNAVLTAVGAGLFAWSTGQNGPSITVNPPFSATFLVTLTNSNGCTAVDDVAVDVSSVNATVSANQTICAGQSATISASGGTAFLWSNGATTATISVSPAATTAFSVTVSNAAGCSDAASSTVTVAPVPTANAGADQTICVGENASLTASGGAIFQWSTGQNGPSITVSPAATATFSVTVFNGSCFDVDDAQVFVNPAPSLSTTPNLTICEGENVNLEGFGSGAFLWSTGATTASITVAPTSTTTFFVTLTDANGCKSFDNVAVTVEPQPTANAGADQQLCAGASAALTASGGTVFLWSNGATSPSITVSPAATTAFSVTVSNGNCSASDAATVTVQPLPTVSVNPFFEEICEGETVVLAATGSAGATFFWSTGQFSPTISVAPTASTVFEVTATSAFGCQNFASATIDVTQIAGTAGPDATICEGENAVLTASANGAPGATFLWSSGQTGPTISVSPVSTQNFDVTITVGNCTLEDAATVFVNQPPTANAGANQSINSGQTAVLTASGGGNYAWSNGQTTASITVAPTVTTTFSVTVTGAGGCTSTDDVTVFVDQLVQVNLGPDQTICVGETATLEAIGGTLPSGTTILWSSGQTTTSITVSPAATADFSVTLTSAGGQTSSDVLTVFVNETPIAPASITGPASACKNSDGTFSVAPVAGATSYFWTVPAGAAIVSGQNSTQIEVNFGASAVGGSVSVVAQNACGDSPATAFSIQINEPPAPLGPLAGDLAPCAAAETAFSIPSPTAGSSLFWTVSGGGFLTSGQNTAAVSVNWNGSAGGQLCVVAENGCGLSPQLCSTVSTTAAPLANAGPDAAFCFQNGGQNPLAATAPTAGAGVWIGSPELAFSNQNDPVSTVSASKSGLFEAVWTVSVNGCVDSDTMKIEFAAPPSVASVVEKCNSSQTEFSVEITLAGGQSPYFLNGSPVAQPFIAQNLASGDSYSFQFLDAKGCAAPIVAGQKTCNCATSVGLLAAPATVCEGDDFSASYSISTQTLDPDDVLTFFLVENAWPTGPILATSATPSFAWQANFAGKSLFIVAVVGSNDGAGQPILAEACTDESQPVAVVFRPLPTALLSPASLVLCENGCDSLVLNFAGSGPFDLVFLENGLQKELKDLPAAHFEKICPTSGATFSLVSVADAFCENAATGAATITVNPSVSASVAPSDQVCNTTASGFSTVRDFKNYVLGGDATGVWVDLDGSGAAGVLPVLDFENIAPGLYRFEYRTAAALAPCPQKSYVLTVEVTANCSCPTVSVAPAGPICDDSAAAFDLAGLVSPSSAAGSWSILSQPAGGSATVLGSTFSASNAAAGVYQLAYTLAVAPPGVCPKADSTTLEIFEKGEAGQPVGSPLEICKNAFAGPPIDLFSMLSNEKAGGVWSENSTILSQNGAFSAASGLFDPKSQAAGSYRFRYSFAANGPCPAVFSAVEILIFDAPTASAGADQIISCQNPTAEIGLVSGQPNAVFEWKNEAGVVISTTEKATATDAGFYFLEVKNAAGCTARDTVEVKNDGSKPTAAIASSAPFLSCDFLTATLDAAASLPANGLTFEWFLNQNSISTASKIDVAAAGIYRLVVTDAANGCTDEQLFDLKADKTTPVLSFLPSKTLDCAVQEVTVEVDPSPAGVVFSFAWAGPQIVAGFDLATVTVAAAGQYSVTVTNETTGCTAAGATQVLANNAAAVVNAGPDVLLNCLQPTVKIGTPAVPGMQYQWSTGETTAQITASSPLISGSFFYWVIATNAVSTCQKADTVLVTFDFEPPTPQIDPSASILTCEVDQISLDAGGSAGGGPLDFEWFSGLNSILKSPVLTVSAAGCYRLEVVDPANGCRDEAEFCVLENKILPFAEASASNDLTCKLNEATLSLAGSTAAGGAFLANWSGPGGFSSDLFSPVVGAGGDYFLTITDTENGCTSTTVATVAEVGQVAFPFEILTKNPTCAGDCDGSVRLENPLLADLEVAFDGGDFESKTAFSKLCSGLFDLKIRDANGCEWAEKALLEEPAEVSVALGPDVFLKLGDSTEVVAVASPSAVRLEWSPTNFACFGDTFCSAFWVRPFENRLFRVTAFDANGCAATDDIFLHVDRSVDVFAPNVFAPESGENGQFSLFFGAGVASIEAFQIFDRWGEKVFDSFDFLPTEAQNLGWDGRFRGEKARPGVFVWFCKFTLADGRTQLLKGDVTVVR